MQNTFSFHRGSTVETFHVVCGLHDLTDTSAVTTEFRKAAHWIQHPNFTNVDATDPTDVPSFDIGVIRYEQLTSL